MYGGTNANMYGAENKLETIHIIEQRNKNTEAFHMKLTDFDKTVKDKLCRDQCCIQQEQQNCCYKS